MKHITPEVTVKAIGNLPENHIGLKAINGVLVPYIVETGAIIAGVKSITVCQELEGLSSISLEAYTTTDEVQK